MIHTFIVGSLVFLVGCFSLDEYQPETIECGFCGGDGIIPGIGNMLDECFHVDPPPVECGACGGTGRLPAALFREVSERIRKNCRGTAWITQIEEECQGVFRCPIATLKAREYFLHHRSEVDGLLNLN